MVLWMTFASNVTVSGVEATIFNGFKVFGSTFDSAALARRVDSEIRPRIPSVSVVNVVFVGQPHRIYVYSVPVHS